MPRFDVSEIGRCLLPPTLPPLGFVGKERVSRSGGSLCRFSVPLRLRPLGRFRDRGHENQQTRAAALNLVTAAIILFNCRYLHRAVGTLKLRGIADHEEALRQLSPLGWDHINLTGDYVWSDANNLDADGYLPLKIGAQ